MRMLSLAAAILALSAVSAEAQRPNCREGYTHFSAPGQADNGTTVALPSGGFQTTYADGWTHTSEPDSSYGAGGRQLVDKDNTGRVTSVTKCDPKNLVRQMTQSEYQNGLIILTTTTWNASGAQTGKDIKRMTAGNPAPPGPQGQQAQPSQSPGNPTAGGPPPGGPPQGDQTMNGPPPGYDQGPNGPPPPPGYDAGGPPPTGPPIGIGGIGFGFGFGKKF